MKSTVLVVAAAIVLFARIDPHTQSMQVCDLTVHEWGTFTSVAGEDGAAIDWDALGCKDDLPGFVNDRGYRNFKFRLAGTVRMETPVMYFYSPRAMDARVKVTFPQGLITEWYPQADNVDVYKADGNGSLLRLPANLNGIDTTLRSLTGAIEWMKISVQPDTTPALPVENHPSRYYAARETDAAPIAVGGQHEKFLFYRGLGRFPVPLSARVSAGGTVIVENRRLDRVPAVILFENRGGRVGYRSVRNVGTTVTFDRPSLDRSLPQLLRDLETTLVANGLFPKEAHAMVDTWRDSWFEEGSRLIYILPSRAVDAVLPLEVEPAPAQTARVFVGRIELVTSETRRSVEEALIKRDTSTLDRYGRFLDPILKRISSADPSKAEQIDRFRREVIGAGRCQ